MNLNLPVNVTSTSQEYLQDIDGQSPGLLQNDGATVCIYFDVSDFIYFIGHHSNLTGIQRVQAQIISSLQALDKVTYNFCSYSHQHRAFVGVDRDLLMSVISELSKRQEARRNLFDASLARIGMLTNTVDSVLPMRPSTRDKNVICLLGAAWVIEDYAFKINDLRRLCNARFVCLFHDLIPIFAKDTCDKGTAVVFERFLRQIVPYIDGVMFVSEHTKRDFQYYIDTSGIAFNKTMTVLKNGSFLDESNKVEFTVDDALKSDYILLVSTIEGRKNHILAFRALEKILKRRGECPRLVCVGRVGWRSEQFLEACYKSNFLGSRVTIRQDISDDELDRLYQGCRFSLYPSTYEGWGLPVGESLSKRRLVIASDASSIPEVGVDAAVYFKSGDLDDLADKIEENFFDDDIFLANMKNVYDYQPVSWLDIAGKVTSACVASLGESDPAPPTVTLGAEYAMKSRLFDGDSRNGDELTRYIRDYRKRRMTSGYYTDEELEHGLGFRSGDGWQSPESDHIWISDRGGQLVFRVPDIQTKYVIYLNCFAVSLIGDILVDIVVNSTLPSRKIVRTAGTIMVFDIESLPNGLVNISLTPVVDDESKQKVLSVDSRVPVLGIWSFMVCGERDFAQRLSILERLTMT